MATPEEETQWILRCQGGDRTAFRQLVERYEKRAFWIAYHMVGHVEDARDIVQDAFLRAFRAIPRFRPERRFYTWFYQIVLHLSIDCLRRRRISAAGGMDSEEVPETGKSDPAERILREESAAQVQDLLGMLPEKERAILILRDLEGFSAKEIAEMIRSNHATVRWWLFLARKRFRETWEARFGRDDPCA